MKPPLATPDPLRSRLALHVTKIVHGLVDDFEWNNKRWRVRFQSWPRKPQEVDPIIDILDVFPEEHPDYREASPSQGGRGFSSPHEVAAWIWTARIRRAAEKQQKHGWHLKKVGDGLEGWFDLTKLSKESSDKKPFASFDLELNGTKHRCQFHVWEFPEPREKPVAWQQTKGPSAGRPSGGKKR